MEFLPKEQCQKVLFCIIFASWYKLDHCAFLWVSYYVQFSSYVYVSLVVCLLFHEGKQKFLQTVLVQGAEEETNTFKKDRDLFYILFFTVVF